MVIDYLLSLPLFLAYLLGAVLTALIAARRKNISSVLGFLGFFLLVGVHLVLPLITPYALRLHSRGLDLGRATVISAFASLSLNLISAVAVLCIVGAIALASRHEWRP
jgi:purine-cytosine permease-like protein